LSILKKEFVGQYFFGVSMGDSPNCEAFPKRVQKLRSLREQLCDKTSEWTSAFEVRDFVIDELREMHLKLSDNDSGVTPEWCKERVKRILDHMCALPDDTTTGEENA